MSTSKGDMQKLEKPKKSVVDEKNEINQTYFPWFGQRF